MSKALKIILIFLVIVIIGVGAWYWLTQKKSPQPQPNTEEEQKEEPQEETENLANINAQDYNPILKSNFSTAIKEALLWQSDAQFVFLKIQISADLNLHKITETYVFDSNNSKTLYWTIGFDLENNYIRALIWKEDFLKNETPKSISTQFWKTDWITCFQKAEENGGKEFRESQGNDLDISASLTYAQPKGYLYWVITYRSLTSGDIKTIQVDANTGEVEVSETEESEEISTENTSEVNPTLDNISQ